MRVLKELVAKIGENMSVRRAVALAVSPGVVASYVHNAAGAELGKIGVLVALKSTADVAKLTALGKQIAMHIAATSPLALTPEHLAPDVVARERAIYADQARAVGQAGEHHREDGRWPHAQILRGIGAAFAGLRDRW